MSEEDRDLDAGLHFGSLLNSPPLAFIVSQMIVSNPLVPLTFFRNRTRVSANVATMLSVAAFLSMFFVLTLYMQDVGHDSALKTGVA